jgi:hypothetical protein
MTGTCRCGQPVTTTLYLHFTYPRAQYEPAAVDPWHIHASTPVRTCGAPGCEAEAYAHLASERPGAQVHVHTEAGAGLYVTGDEGTSP